MKLVKKLIWLAFLLLLLGIAFTLGYYHAVTKTAYLHPEKLLLNEKSILLYDANGQELPALSSTNFQQYTKLCNIPNEVQQAFIDTEDKRFYQHNGFDYKRIAAATIKNLKSHSFKEGASTISQQLIKNTHLSQEKTLKRKLKEQKLTRILEKKYTKEEILERYLNSIYFGHSCFGITSAANFYFDKSPSQLSLPEGAILAGLVKSPNHYSPFKNPEKCIHRRNCVLALMQKNGSITPSQKQTAMQTPLPKQPAKNMQCNYTKCVFDELSCIAEENQITLGGKIQIFTYLDQGLQSFLQQLSLSPECDHKIFALDNATCGFKACVYTTADTPRLPGSLVKPLLVYAPALQENILSPATPILDEKIDYAGYCPENYDGKYHGYISARECVEKSLNIPAVKVLESVGVQKATNYLQKMQLSVDKDEFSLALALGGMKHGFALKDLTSAYATLANGGVYRQGKFIKQIKIDGQTVYTRKQEKEKIFDGDTAYLMTDMLKSTAKNGTAKKMRSLPFDIAAKTGTVGTQAGNTDAYAISYTTKDTISVWLGNADNQKIQHTGGGLPCNYLLQINEYLCNYYQAKNQNIAPFKKPNNIYNVTLDKLAYQKEHTLQLCDDISPKEYTFTELFKKKQIPLNKSSIFTNPKIKAPQITAEKRGVLISFSSAHPTYYQYTITREDLTNNKTKTVYTGGWTECFVDDTVDANKPYIYTITPIYLDRQGIPVSLPSIYTIQEEILQKNWWE